MPFIAPTVGFCSNRGVLRCVDCATEPDHQEFEVVGDNGAFHGQTCETCGKVFVEVRTKDFIRVSHDHPRLLRVKRFNEQAHRETYQR